MCTGVRDKLLQGQDTDHTHPHLSAVSNFPPCCGLSWHHLLFSHRVLTRPRTPDPDPR